jgi:hypothetical protein
LREMFLQQKGSYNNFIVRFKGYIVAEQKYHNRYKKYFMIFFLLLFISGCATDKKVYSVFPEKQIEPCKIAFLGLMSAMHEGEGSAGLFHNPLLNAMISAEPVSQDISDRLSDKLFTLIKNSRNYEMVNMKGYQTSGHDISNPVDINAMKTILKGITADFIITGYVYRMREREGGEYSAANPASASFDIYFIDVKTASISWKGSYKKSQKSLSENILDFKSFLKFKGKWANVESLAEAGLKELVDEMPFITR